MELGHHSSDLLLDLMDRRSRRNHLYMESLGIHLSYPWIRNIHDWCAFHVRGGNVDKRKVRALSSVSWRLIMKEEVLRKEHHELQIQAESDGASERN